MPSHPSDHVLEAIDAALTDYATSPDAMRWAPDAPDPTPWPRPITDPLDVRQPPAPPRGVRVMTGEEFRLWEARLCWDFRWDSGTRLLGAFDAGTARTLVAVECFVCGQPARDVAADASPGPCWPTADRVVTEVTFHGCLHRVRVDDQPILDRIPDGTRSGIGGQATLPIYAEPAVTPQLRDVAVEVGVADALRQYQDAYGPGRKPQVVTVEDGNCFVSGLSAVTIRLCDLVATGTLPFQVLRPAGNLPADYRNLDIYGRWEAALPIECRIAIPFPIDRFLEDDRDPLHTGILAADPTNCVEVNAAGQAAKVYKVRLL